MTSFYWAVITALIWGMVPMLEKAGLAKTVPLTGLYLRCIGVVLGLVIFTFFRFDIARQAMGVNPRNALLIISGGLLASVVGQLFFYNALKLGEVSKVVPIAAAYPVISFLLGVFIFKEGVTIAKISGCFFVLLGIVLLK